MWFNDSVISKFIEYTNTQQFTNHRKKKKYNGEILKIK